MNTSTNSRGQEQPLSTDNNAAFASSNPESLTSNSSDANNNKNPERLKKQQQQQNQRPTDHLNGLTAISASTSTGNISSSNGHEGAAASSNGNNNHARNDLVSSSTQTILIGSIYPSTNNDVNLSRVFTNTQKEVLKLIGQHLQSVGLK